MRNKTKKNKHKKMKNEKNKTLKQTLKQTNNNQPFFVFLVFLRRLLPPLAPIGLYCGIIVSSKLDSIYIIYNI